MTSGLRDRESVVWRRLFTGPASRPRPGRRLRYATLLAITPLLILAAQAGEAAERPKGRPSAWSLAAEKASVPPEDPLSFDDAQLEPIDWNAIDGWRADDHAAAFAAFLASCRPLVRAVPPQGETRAMHVALSQVCRRALAAGWLTPEQARLFFERNFRPLRIAKLGERTGLLTGYYEPIVEGSRFPTGIFKVPIYRRPHDLVAPSNRNGPGFPNRGQSLRRTSSGQLEPYYDRGEILDGALDGRRLEICWIKDHTDAVAIQLQGSARVRLEDGTVLRINYDAHNGYPYVPLSRILIERNIVPRGEISPRRIQEWMRANPEEAEEVRRQNRSFMFFRIVGLSDEREAVGAQGVALTPGRSIAVDRSLHAYGTPFFIKSSVPPTDKNANLNRLAIAQDTGSAIVGPARADVYWGAGEEAGRLANRLRHAGSFTMLVPREIDPVVAGARMPLPREKPPIADDVSAKTQTSKVDATVGQAEDEAQRPNAPAKRMRGHQGARSKVRTRSD